MEYQKRVLQGIIKNLISNEEILVIDTETTGLTYADEIIELAVLNTSGTVLLHTLVKPSRPIPASDTIHNTLRAEGIEQWIASRNGRWNGTTVEAQEFALQLRESKGANNE